MSLQYDPAVDRLMQWESGQMPGPFRITLIPTNRCNLACAMCWRQRADSVDDSEVSDERLLRLVDEAAGLGVREWIITGGGEPMMRASLVMALCKSIRHRGMIGRMNTNGILLNRTRAEEFIEMGWDTIYFGLDGPDAGVNDAIRSPGSFERTKRSMLLLAELKRAHGVERPEAFLNAVLTGANYDRIDQMADLAVETGCTGGLYLSSLVVYGESSAALRLSPEKERSLRVHLDRAVARARELGLNTNIGELLSTLDGQRGSMAQDKRGELIDATCFEAWLNMTILPSGRAGPCCVFWDDAAETIHDKTLEEVWLGAYMRGMRERLIAGSNLPSYCRQCKTADLGRAQRFRDEMRMRQWSRWRDLSWEQRGRFLSTRVRRNLRDHGVGGTLRRAWEWAQIHMR